MSGILLILLMEKELAINMTSVRTNAGRFVLHLLAAACITGMLWLSLSRSAGHLMQQKALFFSRGIQERSEGLQKALRVDAQNGHARMLLAAAAMNRRDYTTADRETRHAFRHYSSLEALNQRASILLNLGRLEEAEDMFEQVVRLHPEEPDARYRLVALSLAGQNANAAQEHLNFMIDAFPENPNSHYYAGMIQAREGNHDRALREFATAGTLEVAFRGKLLYGADDLLYNEGVALAALGRFGDAEERLKKALALKHEVSYVIALSFAYEKQEKWKAAEAALLNGLKLFPGNADLTVALNELRGRGPEPRKEP